MAYWEPICPDPNEIFVIEGYAKRKWFKLGASFFPEDAAVIVRELAAKGKKARSRKYIPHDHKVKPNGNETV